MQVRIDREADAMYIRLSEEASVSTEEIEDGLVVDLDEAGRVVGIEVLYLSERGGSGDVDAGSIVLQAG